jgi:hypothetical protein
MSDDLRLLIKKARASRSPLEAAKFILILCNILESLEGDLVMSNDGLTKADLKEARAVAKVIRRLLDEAATLNKPISSHEIARAVIQAVRESDRKRGWISVSRNTIWPNGPPTKGEEDTMRDENQALTPVSARNRVLRH